MATKHDSARGAGVHPVTAPEATPEDRRRERYTVEAFPPEEVIYQRVRQAHALAFMVVGDGFDSFASYSKDLQHEYLWALSAVLGDAVVALERMTEGRMAPRAAAEAAG
jgi:hypothetical protein